MTDPYLTGIMCDGACGVPTCPKCEGALPFGIGDAIEIKAVERSAFSQSAKETWLPATVALCSSNQIIVVFSDSSRLAVPTQQRVADEQWRKP